jgi:hypothetical protein
MPLIVFSLKNLKRLHTNLLILCAVILLIAITIVGLDWVPEKAKTTYGSINRIFFFLLLMVSLTWSGFSKKKLNTIKAIEDKDQKLKEYEAFVRTRMWASAITFLIIDISWIFTQGNYMFYFLVILLVLQIVTFPRQKFIAAELMDEEIIIE